jgi:hypothetical protein
VRRKRTAQGAKPVQLRSGNFMIETSAKQSMRAAPTVTPPTKARLFQFPFGMAVSNPSGRSCSILRRRSGGLFNALKVVL